MSRFRAYEIEYQGLPITVAAVDTEVPRYDQHFRLLFWQKPEAVLRELSEPGTAMVSEPFTNKHHVKTGDVLTLPIGSHIAKLRIVDVFYDYANERGYVIVSRKNMLTYLPDPAPSNLAVYVVPGADLETVRKEIQHASANRDVLIFSNRELRQLAVQIFDQTFAITYALEAISILVAVVGMAGALLSIVFDRRREFGLLHYLGAGRQPDTAAHSDRSRTDWIARKHRGARAWDRAVAGADLRDQQAVVRLDDSVPLARWRAAGRAQRGVPRDRAGRAVSRRGLHSGSIPWRWCMKIKLSSLLLLAAVCALMLSGITAFSQVFVRALPGYRYQFPRDHFNHPGYQTEWWYYTGNLRARDGHRFGFELTFFREGNAQGHGYIALVAPMISTWRIWQSPI